MSTASTKLPGVVGCVVLLMLPLSLQAEDGEDNLTGSVEVLYRNVNQNGSTQKYDEDFDGLGSGARLANLSVNWVAEDSSLLDFARLDLSGLGGDPYERMALRLGQKDVFELKVSNTKQAYLYNLFELVGNEDGATWDTERRQTTVDLSVQLNDKIDLFFGYREGERTGNSLVMKDIQRDLFRLETPLDQTSESYSVGANFEVGPVDILFRQTHRRYSNNFVNTTEDDLGLEDDLTSLETYEWNQRDRGNADLTSLKVTTPLGSRVRLTASLYGTFLGEEELTSDVTHNAEGTGAGGTCSLSAVSCNSDADCVGGGGDVCVANAYSVVDGFSDTDLDGDYTLLDVDASVKIVQSLSLHLQIRSLERSMDGTTSRDLDGDGTLEDEIQGLPPTGAASVDYELGTIDAVLEYRPVRQVGLRAGYRKIDRQLRRDGFGIDGDPIFASLRDIDLDSDDDTLIFGFVLRPVQWFRLNADYEDGDIEQPFNAVAPFEKKHTRVRAVFNPLETMRIDLGYLDFENRNTAPDIRDPGSNFDSSQDGNNWSASIWHKATDWIDYQVRYAQQEIKSDVRVTFDQAGFATVEDGNSIFDNDNTQLSARVNVRCTKRWSGYVQYWMTESDGDNLLIGDASGQVNNEMIGQEYQDIGVGVTYNLPSGVFIGAGFRDLDYDDFNDLLDYDGQIFTIRGGTTF